jgi:hypothetical protein
MGKNTSPAALNDPIAAVLLLANAAVVAVAAWWLVRALAPELRGPLEPALAWGLAFIALVAGAGALLGTVGGLGAPGFFALHLGALAGLGWRRRSQLAGDRTALSGLAADWRRILSGRDAAAWLTGGLLTLWLGLAVLAACTQPVVYDALTYRLPRIGLWLQDGRIAHYVSDDSRLNYMPVVPDLCVTWLTAGFAGGFHLTGLVQGFGAALLLGSTAGLARQTGLSRAASLGAAGLLFALTSVVVQFTSTHTDVFTAGIFAAAFYLWLAALRRGEGSVWGGLGAGLALGTKGTLSYLAPGALVWTVWLAWRHRAPRAAWRRTLLAGVLGAAIFAGPGLWRNWRSYGGLFGPADMVQLHHGGKLSVGEHVEKLSLNLATSALQLIQPCSQPFWWSAAARRAAEALVGYLPTHGKYVFEALNRQDWVREMTALDKPDADVASCGVLVPLLALAGWLTALWRRRDADDGLILVWGAGVGVFVVFLNAMIEWHPFIFRFLALAAPWVAVMAAWWIEGLPKLFRRGAWALAALTAAAVAWTATTETYQVGWRAAAQPERTLSFNIYRQWHEWVATLGPVGSSLTVALPGNRPLAAFFRQPAGDHVTLALEAAPGFATAEAFLQEKSGWIIVPAARFMGSEGRVMGRVFCFFGQDGRSPYGLAAYRRLAPGEQPAPLLYRSLRAVEAGTTSEDLLVRSWTGAVVLRLRNPAAAAWRFTVITATGRQQGLIAAGGTQDLTVKVSTDTVFQVLITFAPAVAGENSPDAPSVELGP